MATILALFKDTALYLLETLRHNAAVLIAGILIASALQVYLDTERMKRWLLNRPALSIPATVAFGAFTPFCACGTMALVLGMLASALPWGAIMAFLTSSPLMSPDEFVVISGVLGVRFASALTAASLVIGLGSGYLANLLQKRTSFFTDQLRFAAPERISSAGAPASGCGCADSAAPAKVPFSLAAFSKRLKLDKLFEAVFDIGIKKILPLFTAFAAIGYLIKPVSAEQLTEAIHEAMEGGAPMSTGIARRVVQSFQKPPADARVSVENALSPREQDILRLLAKGYLQKEIADELQIAFATVRYVTGRIYRKLHVNSRAQAVAKFLGELS